MNDIEELKKLLKDNLAISEKIYNNTETIRKHFFWVKIFKTIKFTVIIGLIVVGFLYSKPYINRVFKLYRDVYQTIFSPTESQTPQTQIYLDSAGAEQLRKLFDTQSFK